MRPLKWELAGRSPVPAFRRQSPSTATSSALGVHTRTSYRRGRHRRHSHNASTWALRSDYRAHLHNIHSHAAHTLDAFRSCCNNSRLSRKAVKREDWSGGWPFFDHAGSKDNGSAHLKNSSWPSTGRVNRECDDQLRNPEQALKIQGLGAAEPKSRPEKVAAGFILDSRNTTLTLVRNPRIPLAKGSCAHGPGKTGMGG